jgi:hypothetical protein
LILRKLRHTLMREEDTVLPKLAGQVMEIKEGQKMELGGRDCLACVRPRDQKNRHSQQVRVCV